MARRTVQAVCAGPRQPKVKPYLGARSLPHDHGMVHDFACTFLPVACHQEKSVSNNLQEVKRVLCNINPQEVKRVLCNTNLL